MLKVVEIVLEIRKLIICNFCSLYAIFTFVFTFIKLLAKSSQAYAWQWVFFFHLVGQNSFQNFVKCQWGFAKHFKITLRFNTIPNIFCRIFFKNEMGQSSMGRCKNKMAMFLGK
jgi:hypothetical protein